MGVELEDDQANYFQSTLDSGARLPPGPIRTILTGILDRQWYGAVAARRARQQRPQRE